MKGKGVVMGKQKTLRLLVTGSRNFPSKLVVQRTLNDVVKAHPGYHITLVSGNAAGADSFAEEAAERLGVKVERYPADWGKYGKSAGAIRNRKMVDSGVDLCLVYPFGESRGTRNCASMAVKANVPTHIITMLHDGTYEVRTSEKSVWFNKG